MVTDKMNDGVGKKIVEALKMQQDDSQDYSSDEMNNSENTFGDDLSSRNSYTQENESSSESVSSDLHSKIQSQLQQAQYQSSFVDNAFQQSLSRNLGGGVLPSVPDDFEYPANVAVLKQLIGKLPTGVSRQTGAIIIRQTMEALGISMPTVIQEAKQVRETLMNNSKECQASISEYRKQISILEAKSQQCQRQSAVMNDIINLFVQTN